MSVELPYFLKWRNHRLFVSVSTYYQYPWMVLSDPQRLQECLQHSPVEMVCLDPRLGETGLKLWADACRQGSKRIFLRIPLDKQTHRTRLLSRWIKQILDRIVAVGLLLVLSPILLILVIGLRRASDKPVVVSQWRIGQKGQLFQMFKFYTRVVGVDALSYPRSHDLKSSSDRGGGSPSWVEYWIVKYRLDRLLQLINVLRGEMSLVGPRPIDLAEVGKNPDHHRRLDMLPGVTGSWRLAERSSLMDLGAMQYLDLEYRRHWSLWKDFEILLSAVPRLFSPDSSLS